MRDYETAPESKSTTKVCIPDIVILDIPGRPGWFREKKRYADDFVCPFQYERKAQKFYRMLQERLKKFGLELAEDKSRIIPFGRYKGTKENFDFLGFTHYNAKSHWGKYCVLHRTSKKKLKQKRQRAKKWLREHMHENIPVTIELLNKKLIGHYRYYGIYGNWINLKKFYSYVKYELWKVKRRRDQSRWLTWEKYKKILRIHQNVFPTSQSVIFTIPVFPASVLGIFLRWNAAY